VRDRLAETRVGWSDQNYNEMTRVGDLFGPNSASPTASMANSPRNYVQQTTSSPTVNAEVTVNVGDNATPRETGDAVAKAVTGEWWNAPDYSANLVAVDQ
jgi:hypothetical protein